MVNGAGAKSKHETVGTGETSHRDVVFTEDCGVGVGLVSALTAL